MDEQVVKLIIERFLELADKQEGQWFAEAQRYDTCYLGTQEQADLVARLAPQVAAGLPNFRRYLLLDFLRFIKREGSARLDNNFIGGPAELPHQLRLVDEFLKEGCPDDA